MSLLLLTVIYIVKRFRKCQLVNSHTIIYNFQADYQINNFLLGILRRKKKMYRGSAVYSSFVITVNLEDWLKILQQKN